ncbi:hypothetical protein ABH923_002535 [Leifsonia sp. EB41]
MPHPVSLGGGVRLIADALAGRAGLAGPAGLAGRTAGLPR